MLGLEHASPRFQAFNWECHTIKDAHKQPAWLEMLAEKADAISEAGITAVWLPPPCHAISEEVSHGMLCCTIVEACVDAC